MANTWGAMRSYLMEPDELDLVEAAPSRFPASAAQVTKAPRADITQPDRVSVKNTAGVVQKDQDEESEQAKRAKTAIRFAGPEELGPTLDMLRGLPEFEAQRQAADDFENQLAMMREMPTANEAAWVKPLLALADSQTGSNLMKGYTEPTANKDRWQTLIKYGNEVARRKSDIVKNLLEGISRTKSGTDIEQFIRNVKAIDAIENKTGQENFTGDGFVKPSTGKGKGLKQIPAKMAADLGEAYLIPQRVEELIGAINTNKGKMGKYEGAKLAFSNMFGFEDDSSPLQNAIESLRQDIGKMKEGGVLREQDERKYRKMLPTVGTNPETAIKNLRLMQRELSNKIRAHKAGLSAAKYDVEGFGQFDSSLITPESVDKVMKPKYAPGTVKNGYRFKGGDYKDKANWVKVN